MPIKLSYPQFWCSECEICQKNWSHKEKQGQNYIHSFCDLNTWQRFKFLNLLCSKNQSICALENYYCEEKWNEKYCNRESFFEKIKPREWPMMTFIYTKPVQENYVPYQSIDRKCLLPFDVKCIEQLVFSFWFIIWTLNTTICV